MNIIQAAEAFKIISSHVKIDEIEQSNFLEQMDVLGKKLVFLNKIEFIKLVNLITEKPEQEMNNMTEDGLHTFFLMSMFKHNIFEMIHVFRMLK
jgi:hypothetical protein